MSKDHELKSFESECEQLSSELSRKKELNAKLKKDL
jgi:hypothetical protein